MDIDDFVPGDLVVAQKDIVLAGVVVVKEGTPGVVYSRADGEFGAEVRWFNGAATTVLDSSFVELAENYN